MFLKDLRSFYNDAVNAPWYCQLFGASYIATWLMGNLHYFRVGSYTFTNSWGWNYP